MICVEIVEPIHLSRRPAHFDGLDPVCVSQSEVDSGIAGRLVTPSAHPPGDEAPSCHRNRHPSADGVSIGPGSGSLQSKCHVVSADGAVVEIRQRLVVPKQQEVDAAIVVEIARGKASAHARDAPGGSRTRGDIDQPSAGVAHEQLRRA